jgi:hypothetical protein
MNGWCYGLSFMLNWAHSSSSGRFLLTDRNSPASTLFPEAGFVQRSNTEWLLDDKAPRPDKPDWFTVEASL